MVLGVGPPVAHALEDHGAIIGKRAAVDPLAIRRQWRQTGAMTSIQIKGVPEETHAVLRRRAAAAHQSLQEYLLGKLVDEASRPTLDETFDRIEAQGGGGGDFMLDDVVDIIRVDRAGH